MNTIVPLLGLAAVLAVAAIGVSFFAIWRTKALADLADERTRTKIAELHAANAALQKALVSQSEQIEDLQHLPASVGTAAQRAGLNLCKRSQALRMHRKGDPTDRIAAAVEVPVQEVDLLIKVHRIVLGHL